MKKIYIKTTEQCNLNCDHCYIGDNRDKIGYFDEDQTITFLKKYYNLFHEEKFFITFHGGEPFLSPLNKMKKICIALPYGYFTATSNLMILNDNIIRFIEIYFKDENGRPFIKTSWDYRIRFTDEQEKIWRKHVIKLLEYGIVVKVNICLSKLLIENCSPEWLINYFKDIGINEIHFERLSYNTTQDKTLIPDYDKQDEWLNNFYTINLNEIYPLKIDNFSELKYAINGCFIDCRKRECMFNTITINADGTIGACPNTSIKDWYMTIYDDPQKMIRNDKHKTLIAGEHKRDQRCYYCELFKYCNGDCCQLAWVDDKCPAPKKLIRTILNGLEKNKRNIISLQ